MVISVTGRVSLLFFFWQRRLQWKWLIAFWVKIQGARRCCIIHTDMILYWTWCNIKLHCCNYWLKCSTCLAVPLYLVLLVLIALHCLFANHIHNMQNSGQSGGFFTMETVRKWLHYENPLICPNLSLNVSWHGHMIDKLKCEATQRPSFTLFSLYSPSMGTVWAIL